MLSPVHKFADNDNAIAIASQLWIHFITGTSFMKKIRVEKFDRIENNIGILDVDLCKKT